MASKPKAAEPKRLSRGRTRGADTTFPVAPAKAGLPADYANTVREMKQRIQEARLRTVQTANSALVLLYWDLGQLILERQEQAGWGARIIDRLSSDLNQTFPDMKGFSPRNLLFMRAFAEAFPGHAPHAEKVKQLVSQLPWGHLVRLIQAIKDPAARLHYVEHAITGGWSRATLEHQMAAQTHTRAGKAITNFDKALPHGESDLAAQIFKDPYLFDFLGTADPRREAELEQGLVDHIQKFLLELGVGFAFVGRQVRLEVGEEDYILDLLFYHLKLRAYVVIELKVVPFEPEFAGKLNFYLSAVDDLLRHPDDKPSIGLLLCKSKNRVVVEYALRDMTKPIGVAQWETQILASLPKELEGSLPTVEQIEAELGGGQ
jgi:predicted nuclease of restriction endonuclease-like (RecB) superfamily